MIFGLVVTRWLHWAVCILLTSSQLFRVYLVPRREVSDGRDVRLWRDEFVSYISRFDVVALVITVLSLFAWFAVTALNAIGPDHRIDISLIALIATETQFGRVSIARLAILALVGICLFASSRPTGIDRDRVLRFATLSLVALNLIALALVGHAAATAGPTDALHIAVDAVHLAATSVWPGGLVFFALLLRSTIALPSTNLRALAAEATRRFSACSLVAVTVLGMTGLALGFFSIHDASDLWKTPYGQLLTAKVLFFCGMLGFGAQNLFILKNQIRLEELPESPGHRTGAARALFHNVLVEAAVRTLIILIVAVPGIAPTPRS